MLINADVVKVVPEGLNTAIIDSFRPQFYPRMRQAGREVASGKYQNKDKPRRFGLD